MSHRILVLGAGYTGAFAAGRLARRLDPEDVQVTLVNAEPDFVERVRMHQLATGQELSPRPLADLFAGTGVHLRIARVASIDVDAHEVALEGGDVLAYDTLVYGLGSGPDDHGVPGVDEYAHQLSTRAGALRLRAALADVPAGADVALVGGGLTGLEASTEIAEARPDLHVHLLVRGGLGDWLSARGRRHVHAVTQRLGMTVHEDAEVQRVEDGRVRTTDGRVVAARITVWTAGFAVHPIAARSTLAVAGTGRIMVDPSMRSVSHPDVYAVGDAASATGYRGMTLRMSCASGIPVAWQAADSVAARLTGGSLPHVPLRYAQQCISLGRSDGLVQMVTGDDRAVDIVMAGRVAARYKEFVCRGAAWVAGHPTFGLPARRREAAARESRPVTV